MIRYGVRRIISFFVILVAVNAATYLLINFLDLRGPMTATLRDFRPVPINEIVEPYPEYVEGVLSGDLGSFQGRAGERVSFLSSVIDHGKNSLILLGAAIVFSIVIGLLVGFASVNYRKQRVNPFALILSLGGFAMPGFYMGVVAVFLMFTLALRTSLGQDAFILPVSGYGLDEHLILPVIALSARPTAEIARLTAEFLVEELPKEYVRTARAKGLPWRMVIFKHAGRNVIGAVVTALGNSMSYVIGALVIVEAVFLWPGIGEALLHSIQINPFAGSGFNAEQVAAYATAVAVLFLLADMFTDFLAQAVDPRLRRAHQGAPS